MDAMTDGFFLQAFYVFFLPCQSTQKETICQIEGKSKSSFSFEGLNWRILLFKSGGFNHLLSHCFLSYENVLFQTLKLFNVWGKEWKEDKKKEQSDIFVLKLFSFNFLSFFKHFKQVKVLMILIFVAGILLIVLIVCFCLICQNIHLVLWHFVGKMQPVYGIKCFITTRLSLIPFNYSLTKHGDTF